METSQWMAQCGPGRAGFQGRDGIAAFWHVRGRRQSRGCLVPNVHASKSRQRLAEAFGWSTRLACCLRRLAADARCSCVCERHTDLKTRRFGNPVCFLGRHEVFPASRRKQHASRVLHPGVPVARQRHFDASALAFNRRSWSLALCICVRNKTTGRRVTSCPSSDEVSGHERPCAGSVIPQNVMQSAACFAALFANACEPD